MTRVHVPTCNSATGHGEDPFLEKKSFSHSVVSPAM